MEEATQCSRVLGQNRRAQRHCLGRGDGDPELLRVMRKVAETFPRNGCERTHRVLTGPGAFGGWFTARDVIMTRKDLFAVPGKMWAECC